MKREAPRSRNRRLLRSLLALSLCVGVLFSWGELPGQASKAAAKAGGTEAGMAASLAADPVEKEQLRETAAAERLRRAPAKKGEEEKCQCAQSKKNKNKKSKAGKKTAKAKLTLSAPKGQLWAGVSYSLKAKLSPKKGAGKIRWKSSNTEVATVSAKGKLRFKKAGTVRISATAKNGKLKKSLRLTAKESPEIALREEEIVLDYGERKALPLLLQGYPRKNLHYHSSTAAVSVDGNGVLQGACPGQSIVSVTTADGKSVRCRVRVNCSRGLLSEQMLQRAGADECSKLMIVAHPDDETLWGGAHLLHGKWFVLCLTNGYNPTRSREFRAVLQATGNQGIILSYPDRRDMAPDGCWDSLRESIAHDLRLVLEDHPWQQIATHNPAGEYGHWAHKVTSREVSALCEGTPLWEQLHYFGRFYGAYGNNGSIPEDLPRVTERELEWKNHLVLKYKSQYAAIQENWIEMLPHEEWIPAGEWTEEAPAEPEDPAEEQSKAR